MAGLGLTSSSQVGAHAPSVDAGHHGQAWRESLAAVAVVLLAIGALIFAAIVLPWIISI